MHERREDDYKKQRMMKINSEREEND